MLNPIFTQDLRKLINENAEKINNLQDFWSEEKIVGTWFGKKLYKKTLYRSSLINGAQETIAHGIKNIDKIWVDSSHSFAIWQNGQINNLPFLNSEDYSYSIFVYELNSSSFKLKSAINRSNLLGYITLLYTKTTD